MNIVMIASEAVPFAKTGGLADVAGTLPPALARGKNNVCLIMPFYDRKIDPAKFKIKPLKPAIEIKVPIGQSTIKATVLTTTVQPGVTVYFIANTSFYGRPELYQTLEGDYPDNAQRFIFFARAAIELMLRLKMTPDIVHAHDWQASLVPVYLKSLYRGHKAFAKTKTLFTIHNLGYQGMFNKELMPLTGLGWEYFTFQQLEYWDHLCFLKGGIMFADAVSTVSHKYAEEILYHEQGLGLEGALSFRRKDLTGILNGIDYNEWNPAIDTFIPKKFTPDNLAGKAACKEALRTEFKIAKMKNTPIIGIVGRLTSQKGLDIFVDALPAIMDHNVQIVILGTGEARYHDLLSEAVAKYPGRIGLKLAFNNALAHLIEAGSDFFLMPSHYEPCGLNQMISLKYGTIPIVRATGGLDDSISDFNPLNRLGNGFKFYDYHAAALHGAIRRALDVYGKPDTMRALIRTAMACDFSWNHSAEQYLELYRRMLTAGKPKAVPITTSLEKPLKPAKAPKQAKATAKVKVKAKPKAKPKTAPKKAKTRSK